MHQDQQPDGLIEYVYEFMTYSTQGVKFTADCNFIGFMNNCGSGSLVILNNNLPISNGGAKAGLLTWLPGNLFEIDRTQYTATFDPQDITNGTAQLVVIRKIYKNQDKLIKYKNSLSNGK